MWTIWQMVVKGMVAEAKARAQELGIVQIEVFADSTPNRTRFYLVGLRQDGNGFLFSFGDRFECMFAGGMISNKIELPFVNNLIDNSR